MTDDEIVEAYRNWRDDELFSHRDASLSEAAVQVRWGMHKSAAMCRARAKAYGRALALRGVRT